MSETTQSSFQPSLDGNSQALDLTLIETPLELQDNYLLLAAKPLLSLMVTVKEVENCPDIVVFREKILEQIRYFEYRCSVKKYPNRAILAARYALCTALDEAILKTDWGKKSIWFQQNLLVALHNELIGGEKFYVILDSFLKEPDKNNHLLELFYNILSLGFEGKYYKDPVSCIKIRDHLFRILQKYKQKGLPFSIGGPSCLNQNSYFTLPLWVVFLLSSVIMLVLTLVLENYSDQYRASIYSLLNNRYEPEKYESLKKISNDKCDYSLWNLNDSTEPQ